MAATLLLSLTLLVGDSLQWRWLDTLRTTLHSCVEPVYLAISWPGTALDDLENSIRFGSALKRENAHLRQVNLVLSARVQKLSYLMNDNTRLRGLTEAAESITGRVIVTEVVGVDPDTTRHILIVNRGVSSGLYKGQPMLDARGVVGRVQWLGRNTARIMLISDRQHSVPVRINRNGMRAILSGTGDPSELSLQFVPETADIKVGDLLVTSGLGQDFPAGYPVGRVTRIRKISGEQFLDISAQAVASLDRSRYLLALFEQPTMASHAQPPASPPPVSPPTVAPPATPEVPHG